jgi:hypothetical protein
VDPRLWGPPAWQFLRHAAEACDASSSDAYRKFFSLLPEILPCEKCRAHSSEYLAQVPIDTSNLEAWVDAFQRDVAFRKTTSGAWGGAASAGHNAPSVGVVVVVSILVGLVAAALLIFILVKLTKA